MNLQATMPVVSGLPTVVIGTMANTGLTPGAWTSTLLHEHFHQVQFSRPGYYDGVNALDLANGDETGMWMLNYPFSYADSAVMRAFDRYRTMLLSILTLGREPTYQEITDLIALRASLFAVLTLKDGRYMNLQLWQEGAARLMELKVVELLAAKGVTWSEIGADTHGLYQTMRSNELTALAKADMSKDQRICFYSLGWAEASLANHRDATFWNTYFNTPFNTAHFLRH